MMREKSAGAVLFYKQNSKLEYLTLHYPTGHWDFPKGNVEKGEEEEDTVKREIREETGIGGIKLIPGFRKRIQYYYRREEGIVRKEVIFYLANSSKKSVQISSEHLGYAWLEFEDALDKITHKNAKTILSEAHEYIGTKALF